MEEKKQDLGKIYPIENLMPQEEMLEVSKSKKTLTIGIPKEISFQEKRIALVPEGVGLLVANGHSVLIETMAGKDAHFSDKEYSEVGARIVYNRDEIFKCDILLKVAPPTLDEITYLKARQTVISALHLTIQKSEFFKEMMKKKVTALGFEYIKDVTKTYPVIRLMSEIAGTASIYVAADYLCDPAFGKGMMLGGFSGITPAEVVIIGAGTVSEYAARAALGMGASVKVFDNSIYKLRRLQQNLKTSIYTSILHPKTLRKAIREADVAIGAIHSGEGRTSCIVTEDMVREMKAGAVIIDVSIDQGGCFETSRVTSHDDPVYKKYDVTHYCVPNIASRVPNTGSYALSNFFVPMLLKIGEEGGMTNMVKMDYGMRHGIYLFNGILTKKHISEYYKLPFQDIELLMAAFQ